MYLFVHVWGPIDLTHIDPPRSDFDNDWCSNIFHQDLLGLWLIAHF